MPPVLISPSMVVCTWADVLTAERCTTSEKKARANGPFFGALYSVAVTQRWIKWFRGTNSKQGYSGVPV